MDTALSLAVPKEYGYVVLTVASTFFLNLVHAQTVSATRKAAGVAYPRPYAETFDHPDHPSTSGKDKEVTKDVNVRRAEYRFNCAQRAHGQYLEQMPVFLPALMLSGLRWPVVSSALGAGFVASRLVFLWGYVNSSKAKGAGRLYGLTYGLFQLGLIGMTAKMGYDMVFN